MQDERTQKPTQRKLQKARERGEVPKSSELAFALLVAGGLLLIWGFFSLTQLKEIFSIVFGELASLSLTSAFRKVVVPLLSPILLFFSATFFWVMASHLLQTGWIWSLKLKKRGKASFNFLFPFLKIVILAVIAYSLLHHLTPTEKMIFSTPGQKLHVLLREIFFLLLIATFALVLIGIIDLMYQKWRFYKKMHMTKEELREEQKETETQSKR